MFTTLSLPRRLDSIRNRIHPRRRVFFLFLFLSLFSNARVKESKIARDITAEWNGNKQIRFDAATPCIFTVAVVTRANGTRDNTSSPIAIMIAFVAFRAARRDVLSVSR